MFSLGLMMLLGALLLHCGVLNRNWRGKLRIVNLMWDWCGHMVHLGKDRVDWITANTCCWSLLHVHLFCSSYFFMFFNKILPVLIIQLQGLFPLFTFSWFISDEVLFRSRGWWSWILWVFRDLYLGPGAEVDYCSKPLEGTSKFWSPFFATCWETFETCYKC